MSLSKFYETMINDIAEAAERKPLDKLGLSEYLTEDQINVLSKRLLDVSIRAYEAGYERALNNTR